jgi:hypothetical protein
MRKFIFLLLMAVGLAYACTDRDDDVNAVNIRIKNNTETLFNEVLVVENDTIYENIPAGEFSEFIEFQRAFADTELTVTTDSITYRYVPSEVLVDSLPIGFYTYELSFDEEQQIDLAFKIAY